MLITIGLVAFVGMVVMLSGRTSASNDALAGFVALLLCLILAVLGHLTSIKHDRIILACEKCAKYENVLLKYGLATQTQIIINGDIRLITPVIEQP